MLHVEVTVNYMLLKTISLLCELTLQYNRWYIIIHHGANQKLKIPQDNFSFNRLWPFSVVIPHCETFPTYSRFSSLRFSFKITGSFPFSFASEGFDARRKSVHTPVSWSQDNLLYCLAQTKVTLKAKHVWLVVCADDVVRPSRIHHIGTNEDR